MDSLEALLLGVVQGLTEFLPVSSSGHLVLAQALLGVVQEGLAFEIAVHVATLASVVIFYRARIAALVFGVLARDRDALAYAAKLALATLPAVVAVIAIGDFLEAQFESPRAAAFGLLGTGAILLTTRHSMPSARTPEVGFGAALWIGCAQAVAILPGVSRSGSTIAMALALGVAPVAAAEFSFLMSVVAIVGAAVRSLPELTAVRPQELQALAIGGAAAFACGIAAIWASLRLLRTRAFHRFGYYAFVAGVVTLLALHGR